MRIAILGAGGGGASAVAELTQRGHEVTLWNRSAATLESFIEHGGVHYEGVLGSGVAKPAVISDDLPEVIHGADGILVCLPTLASFVMITILPFLTPTFRTASNLVSGSITRPSRTTRS